MTQQQVAIRKDLFPAMTQEKAVYILKKAWPKAPDSAIAVAAIICHDYNLHPLMKQLFIVPHKNKTGETTWDVELGIEANRIIAQRKHQYGYVGRPRMMTTDEEQLLHGRIEPDKFWAIVTIKEGDREFPGEGSWPRDKSPYGTENGNSLYNMAFIHAERNALKKMAPGELPDVDVIDENFVEVKVNQATIEQGKQELIEEAEAQTDAFYPPATDTNKQRLAEAESRAFKDGQEHRPETEDELIKWVMERRQYKNPATGPTTARNYLVQLCKIEPERLSADPGGVYLEVKAVQGI